MVAGERRFSSVRFELAYVASHLTDFILSVDDSSSDHFFDKA